MKGIARRLGSILVAAALLATVAACGSSSPSQAPAATGTASTSTKPTTTATAPASTSKQGGTLTVAFSAEPDTLDVAKTGLTAVTQIMRNVVDTLVWLTPDGKIEPDLATSWKVSADGKTYTFQLRQGVKFQDGTPFNAQAVVDNFNYIEAKSTHSISAIGSLGTFVSAEASGPYTLVVHMKSPYGPFLSNLGEPTLGVQSPTALKTNGTNNGLKPVATGPFEVAKFVPNSQLVLQRNPNYNWAPAAEGRNGPAYLDKVVFDIVEEGQSRVDELQSGQAQIVDATPPLSYKALKSNYNTLGMPIPGAGEYAVINNAKWPTNDANVRKAIIMYIDRTGLVKLADQGVYPVIWGPLQPGTLGYDPEFKNEKLYAYDPAKAAQTLQNDGWKKVNGTWTKNGRPLSLVVTHIPVGDLPALAEGIQSYLQKAGMKVTIKQYADQAWHAANVKGVENITPLEFSDLDPDLLRVEFTPGQYFNWSKYNNAQVTKLVTQGLSETNPQKRLQIYFQAERILMQDAAMLPEHENADLLTIAKSVKGFQTYTGGDYNFYSTYLSK